MLIEQDADAGNTETPKGGTDGASPAADPENPITEHQPAGDENPNGGGEAAGAEAPGGTEGEESGAEAPDSESEPAAAPADPVAALLEKFDRRMEEMERRLAAPAAGPAKPADFSDEQWAEIETRTQIPRAGHKHFAGMIQRGMQALEQKFEERLSGYESERVLDQVASDPAFSDAKTMTKEINAFLSKYSPADRRDPALVKDAVIYSRGLRSKANVARAAAGKDRNKHITGAARPASPGGAGKPKLRVLSPTQRQAASMLPGGEKQYNEILDKKAASGGRVAFE
jgi:hypothetical protein